MDIEGIKLFKIPPRSPDLNPIENLFYQVYICIFVIQVKEKLRHQAKAKQITHESRENFTIRVKEFLENYPITQINALIASMPRIVAQVISAKGQRIDY